MSSTKTVLQPLHAVNLIGRMQLQAAYAVDKFVITGMETEAVKFKQGVALLHLLEKRFLIKL